MGRELAQRFEVFAEPIATHIDRDIWETVQRVREGKRHSTRMSEMDKFSGLVLCADRCRTLSEGERVRTSSGLFMKAYYMIPLKKRLFSVFP